MAVGQHSFLDFAATLQPYMPVFFVSFLVTFLLTPLMRILSHRYGLVDAPDHARKIHLRPIPRLGGVPIFLGWLAGLTIAVTLHPHGVGSPLTIQVPPGVLLGAATIATFGFVDDVRSLRPRTKLLGQLLAALILIGPAAIGLFGRSAGDAGLIQFAGQSFGTGDFFLGAHRGPAWMILDPLTRLGYLPATLDQSRLVVLLASCFSMLAAIAVIIVTCNATNLLDGLDGLSSGITGIISLGYLFLAVYLARALAQQEVQSPVGQAIDPARIALALALLGAVLGFLPFNFHPAHIFMGDTGSMFLGYASGTMILLFGQYGTVRWFLAALVMFGLPLMDALLAVLRRSLNGRHIFSADANHFHHFLLRRGFSIRQAAFISYAVAAIFVSFGLIIVLMPTPLAFGIYLVLFGWVVVGAFRIGMVFRLAPAVENRVVRLAASDRHL